MVGNSGQHPGPLRLVPWLLAGGVALAANLGCKPEAEAVIDELRPLVAPRIERVRALSQKLAPSPVGDPAFERPSSPVVFVPNHRDEVPTAVLVQAEDLENLDKLDFGLRWFELFAECHSLLTTGRLTSRSIPKVYANVARSYLSKCAALEFVFIVRATKLEPRLFEGDVQMFEIDTGKRLGGFDLRVESEGRTSMRTVSKKSVQVRRSPSGRRTRLTTVTTTSEESVNEDREQLRSDVIDAIETIILEHVPDVRVIE